MKNKIGKQGILAALRKIGLVPRIGKRLERRVIDVDARGIPHYTYTDFSRYQPEDCRRLRAERGVGNPKHIRRG